MPVRDGHVEQIPGELFRLYVQAPAHAPLYVIGCHVFVFYYNVQAAHDHVIAGGQVGGYPRG